MDVLITIVGGVSESEAAFLWGFPASKETLGASKIHAQDSEEGGDGRFQRGDCRNYRSPAASRDPTTNKKGESLGARGRFLFRRPPALKRGGQASSARSVAQANAQR